MKTGVGDQWPLGAHLGKSQTFKKTTQNKKKCPLAPGQPRTVNLCCPLLPRVCAGVGSPSLASLGHTVEKIMTCRPSKCPLPDWASPHLFPRLGIMNVDWRKPALWVWSSSCILVEKLFLEWWGGNSRPELNWAFTRPPTPSPGWAASWWIQEFLNSPKEKHLWRH